MNTKFFLALLITDLNNCDKIQMQILSAAISLK